MTEREFVKIHHPYFERLRDIRLLFDYLNEREDQLGGTLQDDEIELIFRARTADATHWGAESLNESAFHCGQTFALHRLCQIVMLYSSFESMCKGSLGGGVWSVDPQVVKKAKNRNKKSGGKENFVIALLDELLKIEMDSDVWPSKRPEIEAFVLLRNHLVHEGLEVSDSLRQKIEPFVEQNSCIPGDSVDKKLDSLGQPGTTIWLDRAYVEQLLKVLEQLGTEVLVPVDGQLNPE